MRFISRFFAKSAIQIRAGTACCAKGRMTSRCLHDISSIAADFGIEDGEIWMNSVGKVGFSGGIPEAAHQRIRNVILMR